MRDFFKTVFASFVSLILFTVMGVGTVTLALAALVAIASRDAEPELEADSILVVDLSTPITDAPDGLSLGRFVNEGVLSQVPRSLSLRAAINAIDEASTDARIAGLYIMDSGIGDAPGITISRELRQAMARFQAEDKPIIAYDMSWNERSYYLTSVADTLILNPNGLLEFNGLSVETLFFAGALQKFGIGVSAIRAGDYKSAVEPFLRSDRSPEGEEQTAALLNDLWQELLTVAEDRQALSAAELQSVANTDALLLPEAAEAAGLIDEVAYFDQVLPQLHELTQEDSDTRSFRQIPLTAYAAMVLDSDQGEFGTDESTDASPHIAVVYAEGSIVGGQGGVDQIGGDRFAAQLRELRLDDAVKAVVLRINSPGGSAAASDIIAREVSLISDEKPIVVSMGSVAASGGYLMATYADQIFASPTTLTGSIGVFGLFPNFQDLANDNGITWDVVKTSPYADIGTVTRPPTDQEVAIAQRFVDGVYDDFLSSVAESRPIDRDAVEQVARGRVWSGRSALDQGLVDKLGGLEEAIAAAAELSDLDPSALKEYPNQPRFGEELFEILNSRSPNLMARLPAALRPIQVELDVLNSLDDPMGVYMRLPYTYTIN